MLDGAVEIAAEVLGYVRIRSEGDRDAPGASRLQEALNQLPEKQRLAIIMFTMQEMPQKQVAEALECSVEAVKWHVFQGRKKLKELLKDHL